MTKAVEYFQKAIDNDPDWAPAYAGQAHAYHELSWYQQPNEVMPKARMAAETALQLDPLSLINNTNLADILADDGQLDLAIQQYLSTIAKDPHFGPAHADLGITYALRGRFSEAIKEIRVGQEYDPDPQYLGWLAWIYARDGRKQQARETLQALDKLSSRQYVPASISAGALAVLGSRDQAFVALQKGVQ